MTILTAVVLGFAIDALIGDPQGWWHPVCLIGDMVSSGERFLRSMLPKTPRAEFWGGVLLWLLVTFVSFFLPAVLLYFAWKVNFYLYFALQTLFCYQIFAAKSLKTESMRVYNALKDGNLDDARKYVSWIVGRDTDKLSAVQITKAAVETVAENTSDGVIAPMIFMLIGGAPLGFFYKAINTLDSMTGYKNDKYLYFGRFSAHADDIANLIPARLSGVMMVLSAGLISLNGKNAWRIFVRDRAKHASPNSAQTEAACAGALEIQLAGDAYYFGKLYQKPTLGDSIRTVEMEDIPRANRLMYSTSAAALLFCGLLKLMMVLVCNAWG